MAGAGEKTARGASPIIDAHVHFWDLGANYHPWLCAEPPPRLRYGDYAPLRRNFLPADYRQAAAGFGVAGVVYVEAEWDPADPVGETCWVHDLARRDGLTVAMVAQARLDAPDIADTLAAQAEFPLVRGIRHKPRAMAAPGGRATIARGAMSDAAWRNGYSLLERFGLSFDLQVAPWHLPEAAELAADFPGIPMIVDHTGQCDDRSAEGLAIWRRGVEAISRLPNTFLKISGLGLACRRWSLADNAAIISQAIDMLGAERCMFASNFPVELLVADFATVYRGFQQAVAGRTRHERMMLFGGTARRVYRLDPSGGAAGRAGT